VIAAYAILGMEPGGTRSQARDAYRARASLLHPDLHNARGETAIHAANAAMRQLNDAYDTVLQYLSSRTDASSDHGTASHPHSASQSNEQASSRWRCPSCTQVFPVTVGVSTTRCPHCRVTVRAPSATDQKRPKGEAPNDSDREVVYEVRNWKRSDRETLVTLLGSLAIPFDQDGEDLAIDKRYEAVLDALITAFDLRSETHPTNGIAAEREVAYDLRATGRDGIRMIPWLLNRLAVPFWWDGVELVVSKEFEKVVDAIATALDTP
jgi:hypothetical protein